MGEPNLTTSQLILGVIKTIAFDKDQRRGLWNHLKEQVKERNVFYIDTEKVNNSHVRDTPLGTRKPMWLNGTPPSVDHDDDVLDVIPDEAFETVEKRMKFILRDEENYRQEWAKRSGLILLEERISDALKGVSEAQAQLDSAWTLLDEALTMLNSDKSA